MTLGKEKNMGIKLSLKDYQREGVDQYKEWKECILGDDMGLGKTLQALTTIIELRSFPCLIICPALLKTNWQREIEKATHLQGMILESVSSLRVAKMAYEAGLYHFFIINYEMLKIFVTNYKDLIVKEPGKNGQTKPKPFKRKDVILHKDAAFFKSIIIDEAHRIGNISSQRTVFSACLADGKEYKLLLTGTPIQNGIHELLPLLQIINQIPKIAARANVSEKPQRFFVDRFVNNESKESTAWLGAYMRETCFLQRLKSDVAKDLPPKKRVISDFTLQFQEANEYTERMNDFKKKLATFKTKSEARKQMDVFKLISDLRQIVSRGKLPSTFSRIKETQGKIIVFCMFRSTMSEIVSFCDREKIGVVSIIGGMSDEDRFNSVDRFQTDEKIKVVVCSTKAAAVGLNLTAGTYVLTHDLPWHWADASQCEDRAFRIGQEFEVICEYKRAVLPGGNITYDTKTFDKIYAKRDLQELLTGNPDTYDEIYKKEAENDFFNYVENF